MTVENFIRVLTGRLPQSTPRSKRLLSDERSNILVYMTGNEFNFVFNFSVIGLITQQKCVLMLHKADLFKNLTFLYMYM